MAESGQREASGTRPKRRWKSTPRLGYLSDPRLGQVEKPRSATGLTLEAGQTCLRPQGWPLLLPALESAFQACLDGPVLWQVRGYAARQGLSSLSKTQRAGPRKELNQQ